MKLIGGSTYTGFGIGKAYMYAGFDLWKSSSKLLQRSKGLMKGQQPVEKVVCLKENQTLAQAAVVIFRVGVDWQFRSCNVNNS